MNQAQSDRYAVFDASASEGGGTASCTLAASFVDSTSRPLHSPAGKVTRAAASPGQPGTGDTRFATGRCTIGGSPNDQLV